MVQLMYMLYPMVANASGINVRPGERSACLDACSSIGINKASAATLFMNAERTAPMPAVPHRPTSNRPVPDWRLPARTRPVFVNSYVFPKPILSAKSVIRRKIS